MKCCFATRTTAFVLISVMTLLAIGIGITAPGSGEKPLGFTVFFIGNRRSEIEPCGCVKNQLGGVQYEASLYSDVDRALSLRVDAGGWSSGSLDAEFSMRARYLLRAMGGFLDLDAVNVGQTDLQMGRSYFESVRKENPDSRNPLRGTTQARAA